MAEKTEKLRRNNRFNLEWAYAGACYTAVKNGLPIPPVPQYNTWEREQGKAEKLVSKTPITPMKVTALDPLGNMVSLFA